MDDYPASEPIPDVVDSQHRELMDFLTNNPEMRKAAKKSLQQGLFAGGGAVAGGLLLGPIGGLVGGIAGSLVGFLRSTDYDGLLQQIGKVEDSRKAVLVQQVRQVLLDAGATGPLSSADEFRGALLNLASHGAVRDQVWRACLDSIQNE